MSPLDNPRPKAAALRWRGHFLLFALLAAFEFLTFDTQMSRLQAWIFPRWSDQVQYLTEGYTSYETAKHEGIAAGYWAAVTKPSAQGVLDCPLVLTIFLLVGPSRSAALALNILFVIAAQLALFTAIFRRIGSPALAWLGAFFFLCWCTVYSGLPGSGADFRLDLMTACAFGISLAILLLSDGLRSRPGAFFFGLSVGLTLLVRFLSGAYFAVIVLGLLIAFCFQSESRRRILNLTLAIVVAAIMAAPLFWLNRSWIINYYWIGHFIGPESALRNPHMNLWSSFHFLIDRLYYEHLGLAFLLISVATLVFAIVVRKLSGREVTSIDPLRKRRVTDWLVTALIFWAGPFLVLAVHSQKSAVVVSVLVVPLMAIVIGVAAMLMPPSSVEQNPSAWMKSRQLPIAMIILIAVGSILNFWKRESTPTYDINFALDARNVNTISDLLYTTSQRARLDSPTVGLDQINESLNGLALRVICYERHKHWVPFLATIPTGLFVDREELLMKRVTESDFMFIAVVDTPAPLFPSEAQLRELRPKHLEWCRANLKRVGQYPLFGRVWELYVKPQLAPLMQTPAAKSSL